MAVDWIYSKDKTQIILPNGKPKSTLKVTGTRFASILGLNTWSTPFQMWCEITKAARLPFEDNQYTIAGKAIEPKVIDYMKKELYANTLDPEEYFGTMRYRNIKFDFFPDEKIFGGMWDAAMVKKKDLTCIRALGEVKTTSRSQDWQDGPPLYYLCQIALYCYLANVETMFISASFLEPDDYNHPEQFVVTSKNTIIKNYNLSTLQIPVEKNGELKLYSFEELVEMVKEWYNMYVVTGISPPFDEEKDKEYLKILRKASPKNDANVDQIIEELNNTIDLIDGIKKDKGLKELEDREKILKENLKNLFLEQIGENDTNIQIMNWNYSKSKDTIKVDEAKMKKDGIYDKYAVPKEGIWKLTQKKVEE